ncbi:MAG: HAD family hydrolase [Acidobacteria bacterium]|nr:HAD family hydrolase [Acidobacteriota bacterium]MBI3654945.1 HAD family hydrolase [Acidobacteriota bacterium]
MGNRRAVFLDRDGTICEELGYINHPSRLMVYPWAAQAIQKINQAGMKAIVVSNQSGVARGYFDEPLVNAINLKMQAELEISGARLDAVYYCPHHPCALVPAYRADCACRKPKPGMALQAAQVFNLDLSGSFVIGDRYGDIQLAHNIGAGSIFILTGYGRGEFESRRHTWPTAPDHIAENLLTAVEWVLSALNNY